jgi:hypothetical protein
MAAGQRKIPLLWAILADRGKIAAKSTVALLLREGLTLKFIP